MNSDDNQDGAEGTQQTQGSPNAKGASKCFSNVSSILPGSAGFGSRESLPPSPREIVIETFGLLLQGRKAFITVDNVEFAVSINVQNFDGAATLHEISSSNDDGQDNNNNFDLRNNAVVNYDFCQSLLGSIQDTGFLDDKNVQTLVQAHFNNNNNSNNNDDEDAASTLNQDKNKIDAATKMIISNSHFFFLAVDSSLFSERIVEVFSRLDVFHDARVAAVAHLLQGRKAFFSNKILENRTDGNAIQQFCSALSKESTEPDNFVFDMKLLDLKTKFGGETPKQIATACVAKQFSSISLSSPLGKNYSKFNLAISWLSDDPSNAMSSLVKAANNSETIFDVIKNPRVFSIRDAIADRWKLHAQKDKVFHRDFSRATGGFAMSLSDTTGRIFESRHVPMHVMDKSALDLPHSAPISASPPSTTEIPSSSSPDIRSTDIDERYIYIVPGSSGVGKTTGCVCYDSSAPRVFIDSGADIAESTRITISELTKFLHQIEREEQPKNELDTNSQSENARALSTTQRVSEDSSRASTSLSNGSDITAATVRGIRDGYASLALLHALLRTFGDKGHAESSIHFPFELAANLAEKDPQKLREKLLRCIRNDLPSDTSNDSKSVCKAMMKRFVLLDAIQKNLQLNADFAGTLYVILDEIGECPELVRGLSSCFDDLRDFLKEILRMKSTSKIVFLAAGTGGSRVATRMYGSRSFETGNIRFCTINPNRVFLRNLLHFKSIEDSRGRFAFTLFNLIFAECPPPPALNGLNKDSPNSSLIYSEDNKAYKIRSGITAAQFRYVQMVIHNSRCAAIAAKIIDDSFAPTSIVNEIFRQNVQSNKNHDPTASSPKPVAYDFRWSDDIVSSMLPAWTLFIAFGYSQRNGLKMLILEDKLAVLGQALRINVTKQLFIDEEVEKQLCVSFGVLEDTAHWIPKGQADETYYHILATDSTGCFHLVCSRQYPRYRISEAFVAFFLTEFGNCSAGIAASVGFAGWELFEQSAADYQLICLILNCFDHVRNTTNQPDMASRVANLPPILALYVKHSVHVTGPVYYRKLSNWLAKTSGQIPQEEFAFWKKVVQKDGGAIVLINGACAPFADIVVITKKVIFLTQCKYLSSSSRSKLDFEGEFKKMHTIDSNKKTREMLKDCCEKSSDVTFVCFILMKTEKSDVEYKCTKGTNDAEGFKYEEHIVAAFEEKQLVGVTDASSAGAGENDTNNENYDDSTAEDENYDEDAAEGAAEDSVVGYTDNEGEKKEEAEQKHERRRWVSNMFPALMAPWNFDETKQKKNVEEKYARYSPLLARGDRSSGQKRQRTEGL